MWSWLPGLLGLGEEQSWIYILFWVLQIASQAVTGMVGGFFQLLQFAWTIIGFFYL